MKIKEIHVRKENLELTRPYTIAYKTISAVESCVVEMVAAEGTYGLGAANPSYQVVGEDMDACLEALSEENLGRLIGRDISEYRSICEDLHRLFPNNPGAKAALDIAYHDLFTKSQDISLIQFLGQKIESLPTSITIGIKNVEETLDEAQEYYDRGFKILKVKLGQSVDVDLERLIKLREHFGNDMGIRVDANQGYSRWDMQRFHKETKDLRLELVEQPLPADEPEEFRRLPEEVRQTVAADESLISAQDAYQMATDPPVCGIYNIKLMKCGGIYQSLRIAEIARLGGIDLMWGCNDESIISISAALNAAFASEKTKYIDLDGSLDLARDVVKGGFVLKDGMMSLAGGIGLGVEKV